MDYSMANKIHRMGMMVCHRYPFNPCGPRRQYPKTMLFKRQEATKDMEEGSGSQYNENAYGQMSNIERSTGSKASNQQTIRARNKNYFGIS